MDVAIAVYERFMLDVRIGRQGLFETQLTMDLIMNCTTMSESGKHQPLFWACQTFREITLVCVAACLSNRRVFARFSVNSRSVCWAPCLRFGTPYVRPRARLSGARRRWPQLRPGDHAELAHLGSQGSLVQVLPSRPSICGSDVENSIDGKTWPHPSEPGSSFHP